MSQPSEAPKTDAPKGVMQRILDVVEKVGNKVPHPVVIFLILIAIVIALSAILGLAGVAVTYDVIVPQTQPVVAGPGVDGRAYESGTEMAYGPQVIEEKKAKIETRTREVRSLLDGRRDSLHVCLAHSELHGLHRGGADHRRHDRRRRG